MVGGMLLVFSLFTLTNYANSQAGNGDPCTVSTTGQGGECVLLSMCQRAMDDLNNNIYPERCGFQDTEPIVCCVGMGDDGFATTTTTTTSTTRPATRSITRTTTRPTTSKPKKVYTGFGAKSREKCDEYGQFVYEKQFVPGLRREHVLVEYCALVPIENIVGGIIAKPQEFPHMALLGFEGNKQILWQCGGTLISDEYVLTAAHCLYSLQWGEPKYIRIGELRLDSTSDDSDVQDFNIIKIIKHPNYTPPSKYHDIGLLRMHKKARLNPYARPACLNVNSDLRVKKAIASGWGQVEQNSHASKDLLKVTLELFSNEECKRTYRRDVGVRLSDGIMDATQLCAGSHNESKDTCLGDSGGPLQIVHPEVFCMYSVVGITSFGKICGVATIPGVYTRVSNYIDWIEKIVWP